MTGTRCIGRLDQQARFLMVCPSGIFSPLLQLGPVQRLNIKEDEDLCNRPTFRSWPFNVAMMACFLFSTAPSSLHCAELLHTRTFGLLPTCDEKDSETSTVCRLHHSSCASALDYNRAAYIECMMTFRLGLLNLPDEKKSMWGS